MWEVIDFIRLAGQEVPRFWRFLASSLWRSQVCAATPGFYMGPGYWTQFLLLAQEALYCFFSIHNHLIFNLCILLNSQFNASVWSSFHFLNKLHHCFKKKMLRQMIKINTRRRSAYCGEMLVGFFLLQLIDFC